MPLADIEDAVVGVLDGVGGLVDGTNLFRGPVRSGDRTPDLCVFVMETSGDPPIHYRAATEVRRSRAQIRIRSAAESYEAGLTLARLLVDTVHRAPPSGFIELEADTARALPLGRDEVGRWEWSLNVTATIDE